ncbi:hypothetical protein LMH87_001204 [Akanthomyces muscarius]|uniref:Uncharacterized protein n=1 Tax=Akanthomyces muscarius TaxID=2231603 RepID=A0A9W8QIE8_AKAMU|nr:hypothetical protein LMH87_001204 [Akanthomyces muscarius]KAJ4155987.1 hypothetical protein LMH87_001204 [Akanthomyces muscarius]
MLLYAMRLVGTWHRVDSHFAVRDKRAPFTFTAASIEGQNEKVYTCYYALDLTSLLKDLKGALDLWFLSRTSWTVVKQG